MFKYASHAPSLKVTTANIADMSIPSQSICNSDPKILDTFDIFEDRSLQSIWSMDLFDPFPCYLHHIAFDRLESHTPFLCPATQLIYAFLKFQCVLCSLNFSVANTVIRKESYFRINGCLDIINVKKKKKKKKKITTWDQHRKESIHFSTYTTAKQLSVAQKRIYPLQYPYHSQTVVCSTEKNLSTSVSSHRYHSQTVVCSTEKNLSTSVLIPQPNSCL